MSSSRGALVWSPANSPAWPVLWRSAVPHPPVAAAFGRGKTAAFWTISAHDRIIIGGALRGGGGKLSSCVRHIDDQDDFKIVVLGHRVAGEKQSGDAKCETDRMSSLCPVLLRRTNSIAAKESTQQLCLVVGSFESRRGVPPRFHESKAAGCRFYYFEGERRRFPDADWSPRVYLLSIRSTLLKVVSGFELS